MKRPSHRPKQVSRVPVNKYHSDGLRASIYLQIQLFAKTMTFGLRLRAHANDAIKSGNSEDSRGPNERRRSA